MIPAVTVTALAISWLLLLLVTLSVPIINSIYLMDVFGQISLSSFAKADDDVKFGVFGWCTSGASGTVFGITDSESGSCSSPHLGYSMTTELTLVVGNSKTANIIDHGITVALVLHPLACGLVFLTLLISIFMILKPNHRLSSLFTFGVGCVASLITTIIFIIDVAFVAIAKSRVHKDTDGIVTLTWGNAVWMILGAMLAVWIGTAGACFGVCSCSPGRRSRSEKV